MSKTCSKCGENKDESEFYSRGGKQKHLLQSRCKSCFLSEEQKVKQRERNKTYRDGTLYKRDKENPVRYLWRIARKRCSDSGMEFTIQPEDIMYTGYCPILKTKLSIGTKTLEHSMSLDRVDNTKGYVPGNVVAISRWANLKKSDMSISDLEGLIKYIKEYSN